MNRKEARARRAKGRTRHPVLHQLTPQEHVVGGHGTVALRLVAETPAAPLQIIGSAFMIGRGLVVTASHNIREALRVLGQSDVGIPTELENIAIRLYQVAMNAAYVVYEVRSCWLPSTLDLALLEVNVYRQTDDAPEVQAVPIVQLLPPRLHAGITALGYRKSALKNRFNESGVLQHIEMNDEVILAKGRVTKIYPERRDSVLLPFPCFEVDVRFDAGLSGGPVMDNSTGAICGMVSTSIEDGYEQASAVSYASTLWPLLQAQLMPGRYSTIAEKPNPILLDLALEGSFVTFKGIGALDPSRFPNHVSQIESHRRARGRNG